MADVWAIYDIIFVHSLYPLLLGSYLFFCKIRTVFAFISLQFIVIFAISMRIHIRLGDVGIAIVLHHASFFPIVFLATVLAETVGPALATILSVGTAAEAIRG